MSRDLFRTLTGLIPELLNIVREYCGIFAWDPRILVKADPLHIFTLIHSQGDTLTTFHVPRAILRTWSISSGILIESKIDDQFRQYYSSAQFIWRFDYLGTKWLVAHSPRQRTFSIYNRENGRGTSFLFRGDPDEKTISVNVESGEVVVGYRQFGNQSNFVFKKRGGNIIGKIPLPHIDIRAAAFNQDSVFLMINEKLPEIIVLDRKGATQQKYIVKSHWGIKNKLTSRYRFFLDSKYLYVQSYLTYHYEIEIYTFDGVQQGETLRLKKPIAGISTDRAGVFYTGIEDATQYQPRFLF